jgi:RHS repeat-associated protein
MRARFSLFSLLLCLSFAPIARAQVQPGVPSFVPQDCHEFDCVNLLNNNVMLNVPIREKSGMFAMNTAFTLNSYIYSLGTHPLWTPSTIEYSSFVFRLNGVVGGSTGYLNSAAATCPTGGAATTKYWNFFVVTGDGSEHILPSTDVTYASPCNNNSPLTDVTTDNSGYVLTVNNKTVSSIKTSNGTAVAMSNSGTMSLGSLTDSNGNVLSLTGSAAPYTVTDTMGLTALSYTPAVYSAPTATATWTDINGHAETTTANYSSQTLETNFACTVGSTSDFPATSVGLPTGASLADGRSIGITYEATPGHSGNVTGRIGQITLPETGSISYSYGQGSVSGCSNGINPGFQTVPVLTRKLGNGDTTTYTLTYSVCCFGLGPTATATNTVVDPGGNQAVYTFSGLSSSGNQAYPVAQVVTEIQKYQGTSTLLTTDLYSYNTAFTSTPSASTISATTNSFPISKLIVYHQISGMSNWSATETHYDNYGNVTYSAQYDFGGTTPVRATTVTYGSCTASCTTTSPTISNTSMAANGIYNKAGEIVRQQNGTAVAQTNITYDAHGNLLSKQVWTGSAFIGQTTANAYNTNGTIAKSYDLANNETDYSYVGGSYSDNCGTIFPFPTTIKNVGTGLSTSSTYDCEGGVKLTDADSNGNTTTYGYVSQGYGVADPYWRINSVTDPYGSIAYKAYPSGTLPDESAGFMTFNSGNSAIGAAIYTDGYGRTVALQTPQTPGQGVSGNFDTVSTSYGWSGNSRQVQTSQLCSTAWVGADGSCALVHTYEYDPLTRLLTENTTSNETVTNTYTQNDVLKVLTPAPSGENSKQVQTEYDSLGRVSKVCHIGSTSSTGSGTACGQNTGSANGATDVYTYSQGSGYTEVEIQRNALQTRWAYYDGLGRLIQKRTPEGGTWYYVYDFSASCPAGYRGATGQLAEVKDPNGNAICYAYDSLNRVTGVNANSTTCRHFYYDNSTGYSGTIPTGITLANQYGRLVEGATDKCSSGTLTTDEWFAYDQDGRNSDMWESSYSVPSYYYHSHVNFYANGTINTLQIANPSYHTFTYGLDGEGRWYSLTDTTASQNIVTSVKQFPANNPVVVNLTGTTPDNDAYTIDQYTGRVDQYVFSVGNTPTTLKGVLNWNADGTLGSLATTDGFDSGGSLTCADAYDDWTRLVKFDCGSGNWGQQYAYDVYNNLTKTVLSGRTGTTWNPGYSSSTNQCTGCSFDSDGNTTADGGGNYWGWNEFSKQQWYNTSSTAPSCGTSGKCIVYDAFGHIVAYSSTTAWVDQWQMQGGALATLSASSLVTLRLPAPGHRGLVEVNPNTSGYNYLHGDWLGNARVLSSVVNNTEYDDRAYTPYGEQFTSYGLSASVYQMFAGMTADFNNGLQYETPNREFSVVGRWLSPDPAGAGWNQYAYATNPNSFVDPLGLQVDGPGQCSIGGDSCTGGGTSDSNGDSANCSAEWSDCSAPYYEGLQSTWAVTSGLLTMGNGQFLVEGGGSGEEVGRLGYLFYTYKFVPDGTFNMHTELVGFTFIAFGDGDAEWGVAWWPDLGLAYTKSVTTEEQELPSGAVLCAVTSHCTGATTPPVCNPSVVIQNPLIPGMSAKCYNYYNTTWFYERSSPTSPATCVPMIFGQNAVGTQDPSSGNCTQ